LLTNSRTRHSGEGRPNLQQREAYCSPVRTVVNLQSSSDSEYMHETLSSSEDDDENEDEAKSKKPSALQVILDVSTLTTLFEKLCACPRCGGKLLLFLKTTCLSTSMIMSCTMTRKCGFTQFSDPPAQVN
jgi:hypothetical protein